MFWGLKSLCVLWREKYLGINSSSLVRSDTGDKVKTLGLEEKEFRLLG